MAAAVRTIVNPTPSNSTSVHINAAMTDVSLAYSNDGFLADQLVPVIPVEKRSDSFYVYSRRDVAHVPRTLMGPSTPAPTGTHSESTGTYIVKDYGRKQIVSRAMQGNADPGLDPLQDANLQNMQELMLERESRAASLLCTSSNYGSNTAAASVVWSNESTGVPLSDINTGIAAIPFSGGDARLIGFCCRTVWNALRKHPQILGLKGLAASGQASRQEVASFFELDDILVSDVTADTNNIGQSASYSYLYTATVFGIVRVPKTLTRRSSAFGVTFRVKPGVRVDSWYDQDLGVDGSDVVVTTMSEDIKQTQSDMGYLITGVL